MDKQLQFVVRLVVSRSSNFILNFCFRPAVLKLIAIPGTDFIIAIFKAVVTATIAVSTIRASLGSLGLIFELVNKRPMPYTPELSNPTCNALKSNA